MRYQCRDSLLVAGLLVSLALSAGADSATWFSGMQTALNANDFDALVCSQAVRSVDWPAIYSRNTAQRLDTGNPGIAATNGSLYALALNFNQQLRSYAPTLSNLNDAAFLQRMDNLLEIRDRTQGGTGLINQLTSDTLSRVLLVSLAERFGSQTQHTEWVCADVSNAVARACPVSWIVDVFAVEQEWPTSTVAQIKGMAPDAAVQAIAQEIGSSIETVLHPYGTLQNVGLFSMLGQEQPSLLLSLYRSLNTEALLRTLVLGDLYKKNAATFSLSDSASTIDGVLPQAPSGYSYTLTPTGMTRALNSSVDMTGWCIEERLSRARYTGRHIERLFQLIGSGSLGTQRLFSGLE